MNRIFTVDRQVGVQLRGRLFKGSLADLNYYAGVFNGEGRSVKNSSDEHLYVGRLQWNFLGRQLKTRQTDVEFTELPTGSFAVAGLTNEGPCTRWSSSGCGNLDGFAKPAAAQDDRSLALYVGISMRCCFSLQALKLQARCPRGHRITLQLSAVLL